MRIVDETSGPDGVDATCAALIAAPPSTPNRYKSCVQSKPARGALCVYGTTNTEPSDCVIVRSNMQPRSSHVTTITAITSTSSCRSATLGDAARRSRIDIA